jgi:hypothetical protein
MTDVIMDKKIVIPTTGQNKILLIKSCQCAIINQIVAVPMQNPTTTKIGTSEQIKYL